MSAQHQPFPTKESSVFTETIADRLSGRENAEVVWWRWSRLVAAGFEPMPAYGLAVDSRIDVHALLDLVARGCPPDVAARILAPLEERRRATAA
jgi:hypothetical protein